MLFLVLKTWKKDGTSSSLNPRQSKKEVNVTESNFVFCQDIFHKTYPRVDEKLSEIALVTNGSVIHGAVRAKMSLISQNGCASACRYVIEK